jgi:hypothetical protein
MPHDAASRVGGHPEQGAAGTIVVVPCGTVTVVAVDVAMVVDDTGHTVEEVVGAAVDVAVDDIALVVVDDGSCVVVVDADVAAPTTSVVRRYRRAGRDGERRAGGAVVDVGVVWPGQRGGTYSSARHGGGEMLLDCTTGRCAGSR